MKVKFNLMASFFTLALIWSGAAAFAEDQTVAAANPAEAGTGAPAVNPEMDAMMAKMKEASTPGEGHKVLEPLIGSWNATVKSWMKPNAAPQESQGSSETQWILGGRFIEQRYTGTFMGQPFEGIGITGYDNVAKKYQNLWIDSIGTGMMVGNGTYDAASNTITDAGTFSCPMAGADSTYRSVLKFIDAQSYAYEMYMMDPKTGQEVKGMEILYTKKV